MIESFVRQLPKADIHLHLDGSARPTTVLELSKAQNAELPTDLEELTRMMHVDENTNSLDEYLSRFSVPLTVMQEAEALERISFELAEDCFNDGITYAEIRFSPYLHVAKGLALDEIMVAVWTGAQRAMAQYSIVCRFIVCGLRHMTADQVDELARLALRHLDHGVVAFDMAGSERGLISQTHPTAIEIVHSNPKLRLTLHSGEAAGAESVRDSIVECRADRIGHGVRMREDPTLVTLAVGRRVALEMCPTSNLQTKTVLSMSDWPIRQYLDAGLPTVICTDNRTVSNITLTHEYMLVHEQCGLTLADLARVADYGFEVAFIEEGERKKIRQQAREVASKLLLEHGVDPEGVYKVKEV
ncbi:Adenosine/adenine deaminase [Carpediemonas membranifera]|uniref:adenosine deaminase n=1 Tax=Carpediemonas membranifera TaxID=201153 RepID=A0A8J6B556_9EUKA|nr:Adenosine/adenine deaminase [Carpediemonas membranifera]|eukprot:KAG9394504.1 Adenosine/adenine deaminase [Carpediemonas membranifera]